MPWESRKKGLYYYRAVRIEGLPRRIYFGAGAVGRIHAILDRAEHRRRELERSHRTALHAELAEEQRVWRTIWPRLRALAAAELLTAGWYNHRGTWRKVMNDPRDRQHRSMFPVDPNADPLERLSALNVRANAGEPGAREELRKYLQEDAALLGELGNLTHLAAALATKRLAPTDPGYQNLLLREALNWRDTLIGPDATPVERALADTALSARLSLMAAEMQTTTIVPSLAGTALKAKCLDRAQHRLSTIVKKLHDVQRATAGREAPAQPKPPASPQVAKAG